MRFASDIAGILAAAGRDLAAGVLDLLLPNLCGGCEKRPVLRGRLCEDCTIQLLERIALPYCPRCGATLGPNVPAYPDGCAACPSPLPRFARVHRLGPYAPPLRRAIRRFKFHRRFGLLGVFCAMLAQRIRTESEKEDLLPEVVVPVPAFWLRRMARGVDHAALLAEGLARELSLPLGEELLRVRNTPQQAHLPRTRRLEAVRGAFQARSPSALGGARVLLVDDVTTTGATADECARTLLRAGATRVHLAVLAKAEPPAACSRQEEA